MNAMPAIVRFSGPWGLALVVLAGVVLFHAGGSALAAVRSEKETGTVLRNRTNTVLFWGVASAVLGILGQCHSVYLALNEILQAPEVSPQIVAEGFVISFMPALFGLGILAFSSLVWLSLRALRREGSVILLALSLLMMGSGCETGAQEGPLDLTEGVWAFEAGQDVFLWDFTLGADGVVSCVVHDVVGGREFTETPCAEVNLEGTTLSLEMPNGVRYQGQVDLGGGRIEGSLHYLDGTSLEAPFVWAPEEDYPSLSPRAPGSGPYAYRPPEEQSDGLEVAPAAERGVDPEALERTVGAVLNGEAGFLKSLLVLRGSALLLEEYFHGYGPNDLFPIASCTKSVSSLLVGLAIQEGRIPNVEAPLLEFFPQQRAEAGSGWADLTLEHLLTMSLALDWSPQEAESLHGTGPDAFRQILARTVAGRPGSDWEYVSMNVNLLAGVIHQATGEHAEPFAARALFEPLGITEWDWDYGKTGGFNLMDGSLRLRPRDMAKIGVMMLNGGRWQDRRVLGEEWVRRSLTPLLPAGSDTEGYGYLWWTMDVPGPTGSTLHAEFANGWGSQFIILFPELDLVVVTTGGNQENGKHLAIGEVLVRELVPGVIRS